MIRNLARVGGRAADARHARARLGVPCTRAVALFDPPDRRKELLLARTAGRLPTLSSCEVSLAAWAVSAAARRVPGTRCLAWSLALRGLLAQMGIASRLRIGVAAGGDGRLDAHAWVECEGQDWSWGEPVGRYGVLRPPAIRGLTPATSCT